MTRSTKMQSIAKGVWFWGLWRELALRHRHKNKTDDLDKSSALHRDLAEREGFEPPEQLPVHRISSAARSTTPAPLLMVYECYTTHDSGCKYTNFFPKYSTYAIFFSFTTKKSGFCLFYHIYVPIYF